MDQAQILATSGSVIVSLLGVLLCVIGWLGSRVVNRLDILVDRVDEVKGDLQSNINELETRLVRVEILTAMTQ